jgi:hypothetical protein
MRRIGVLMSVAADDLEGAGSRRSVSASISAIGLD